MSEVLGDSYPVLDIDSSCDSQLNEWLQSMSLPLSEVLEPNLGIGSPCNISSTEWMEHMLDSPLEVSESVLDHSLYYCGW